MVIEIVIAGILTQQPFWTQNYMTYEWITAGVLIITAIYSLVLNASCKMREARTHQYGMVQINLLGLESYVVFGVR